MWKLWTRSKDPAIIAVGELGYDFDTAADPDSYDVFMHIDINFLELAVSLSMKVIAAMCPLTFNPTSIMMLSRRIYQFTTDR